MADTVSDFLVRRLTEWGVRRKDGEPQVHVHVSVAKRDGTAHGGHLLEGHVWPTLEVLVTESPTALAKRHDPETGLALIDLRDEG